MYNFSFLKIFTSKISFNRNLARFYTSSTSESKNVAGIENDWKKVGQDMRNGIVKYDRKQLTEKY